MRIHHQIEKAQDKKDWMEFTWMHAMAGGLRIQKLSKASSRYPSPTSLPPTCITVDISKPPQTPNPPSRSPQGQP